MSHFLMRKMLPEDADDVETRDSCWLVDGEEHRFLLWIKHLGERVVKLRSGANGFDFSRQTAITVGDFFILFKQKNEKSIRSDDAVRYHRLSMMYIQAFPKA